MKETKTKKEDTEMKNTALKDEIFDLFANAAIILVIVSAIFVG